MSAPLPRAGKTMAQSSDDEDENPENPETLLNEWLGELHILTEVRF